MSKVTLRAKDGTEITGELWAETEYYFNVCLAEGVAANGFHKDEWSRVHELPTKVGTVFRATVCGVENVRVMVASDTAHDPAPYVSAARIEESYWHSTDNINASTVVIEMEG